VNSPRLLIHCPRGPVLHREVLEAVDKIDKRAKIKREWANVIEELEAGDSRTVDVVIDVLGRNDFDGLEHLQDLWSLKVLRNHAAVPLYLAVSCSDQPASFRYEVRRLGGFFMLASDVPGHFGPLMEEIRLQLDGVRRLLPRWEIVEESSGSEPVRAYVFFRFAGKLIQVRGSDRHLAVLAVLLKNNGIPRSMKALRQLCSDDPLFEPAGGSFDVPQLATLKMYLYRDFPRYLQMAFDDARASYYACRVIEHIDLGARAMGFRVRGISTITVR
jgi:hypothetical protein